MDAGKLRSTSTETYGKSDAANLSLAHKHIESGKAVGKAVLEGF